jgi:hypothetical protein
MAARKGIPAGAFMASFSSAGRIAAPRTCCNCQTKAARWNSIYCSDACEREFLTFPEYNDEFSSKEIN